MDLTILKTPKIAKGQEDVLGMEPGDMIEITKNIGGTKTVLLEYVVPDGQTADAFIELRLEIDMGGEFYTGG